MKIQLKRVYLPPADGDGFRVLVDRLWPRGISKEKAALNLWAKEVAPSRDLCRWFQHEPAKWADFKIRYALELAADPRRVALFLEEIQGQATLTLLFGAKDEERNQAAALKEYLEGLPFPDREGAGSRPGPGGFSKSSSAF